MFFFLPSTIPGNNCGLNLYHTHLLEGWKGPIWPIELNFNYIYIHTHMCVYVYMYVNICTLQQRVIITVLNGIGT